MFVEIKRASLTRFGYDQVVARVVNTLKPARGQCVVISFDLAAVHRVRQIGGMPIGWVLSAYDAHTRLKFEALQPEFLFVDHEMLPPGGAAVARPVALGGLRSRESGAGHGARRAWRRLHRDHGGTAR